MVEELARIDDFAKKLAGDLGFATHELKKARRAPMLVWATEAVPREAPDEWEVWSCNGWFGEQRRQVPPPPTSVVAQQADGMPGIAFRLGCRHDEPRAEIPNGKHIECIAKFGERLIVAYGGKVGFVKQRNVAAAAEECTPLAALRKLVARQADGRSTVAFYVGELEKVIVDVPNATELSLLQYEGDHAIVYWSDIAGFIEKRHLVALPVD